MGVYALEQRGQRKHDRDLKASNLVHGQAIYRLTMFVCVCVCSWAHRLTIRLFSCQKANRRPTCRECACAEYIDSKTCAICTPSGHGRAFERVDMAK